MKILILILTAIFFHLLADYTLQGILGSMKKKSWWEDKGPAELVGKDYICALIEHGFSWTFMINIPVIIYLIHENSFDDRVLMKFAALFIINWIIHVFVDDLKANRKKINLCIDQAIHVVQVIVTVLLFVF